VALYRIYVPRNGVLRYQPGDYETTEVAKVTFEKHRGDTEWCLIGDVDSHTERPTFVLRGQAAADRQVEWKQVFSKRQS
jgi:hypothetical protein